MPLAVAYHPLTREIKRLGGSLATTQVILTRPLRAQDGMHLGESTAGLSADRLITQLEMTASTEPVRQWGWLRCGPEGP